MQVDEGSDAVGERAGRCERPIEVGAGTTVGGHNTTGHDLNSVGIDKTSLDHSFI